MKGVEVVCWIKSLPVFYIFMVKAIQAVDHQCTFQHISLHDIQTALKITEAIHKVDATALRPGAQIDNTGYRVANITTKYLNELQGEVLSVLIAKKESKRDRTTIIAFRGTDGLSKTIDQFKSNLEDYGETDVYFRGKKTSVNKYIWMSFSKLYYHIEHYLYERDRRYIITGHSIGGAMASLLAAVTKSRNEGVIWDHPGTCLITFGAPRVGDSSYAQTHEELISPTRKFRFINRFDVVPHLPTSSVYQHHSREIWINKENAQLSWNSVALLENPKRFTYWKICGENEPSYCSNRISDLRFNPFDHGLLKYKKSIFNAPRVYYGTKGGKYSSWPKALDASCPSNEEEFPFTLPRVQKTQTEADIESELPPDIATAVQNPDNLLNDNQEGQLIVLPDSVVDKRPEDVIEAEPEPLLPPLSKDDSEILAAKLENEANKLTLTQIPSAVGNQQAPGTPITIIHTPDEIFDEDSDPSNTRKGLKQSDVEHENNMLDLSEVELNVPNQPVRNMTNKEVEPPRPLLLGRLIASELEKDNITADELDDNELAAMTPSLNDDEQRPSSTINLMTYNLMHRTKFDKQHGGRNVRPSSTPLYKAGRFTQNNKPLTSQQVELTGNISLSERNKFSHFLTLVARKEEGVNNTPRGRGDDERKFEASKVKGDVKNKLFENYLTLVEHSPGEDFEARGVGGGEQIPKESQQPVNVIDIMKLYVPTKDLDAILNQNYDKETTKRKKEKTGGTGEQKTRGPKIQLARIVPLKKSSSTTTGGIGKKPNLFQAEIGSESNRIEQHNVIEEEGADGSDGDNINNNGGEEKSHLQSQREKNNDVTQANFDDVTEEKTIVDEMKRRHVGNNNNKKKDGSEVVEGEGGLLDPVGTNKVRIQVAL